MQRKHAQQMTKKEIEKCKLKVSRTYSKIHFSGHAIKRNKEKHINITIPEFRDHMLTGEVIEIEHDTSYHVVVRFLYQDKDVVASIREDGYVVTMWVNSPLDNHDTLNLDNYDATMTF